MIKSCATCTAFFVQQHRYDERSKDEGVANLGIILRGNMETYFMKKDMDNKKAAPVTETKKDLKEQTTEDDTVKKGYNEKNPTQPQGAFKPDASSKKN